MNVLESINITKRFPGVVALESVSVAFEPGKIHCIVGENGAGKSTLIKILTGVQPPDEGQVVIMGADALQRTRLFDNVAYVPQEIDLFKNMSVAENLFMPYDKSGFTGLFVSQSKIQKAAVTWLDRFKITASPEALVKDVSVSEQQLLQIARAMVNRKANILMLDEPTTSLTSKDTALLFEVIMQIKKEDKAIIFISHKLEELMQIGDCVTVLRNGKKIAHASMNEVDIPWMIEKMAGHKVDQNRIFCSAKISDETLLKVSDLTGDAFSGVSFELKKGEILGFSGLNGAGRSELTQSILGILPVWSGDVELSGKKWKLGDPSFSVRNGYIYLPEERKQQGILQYLSLANNISITVLDKIKSGFVISGGKETRLADTVVQKYNIKAGSLQREIRFLSGGNQQKTIIGRAMYCSPSVLVFDEPTKGIDVGTKEDIYALIKELAEEYQIGVIIISSEIDEVLKCSNRIITMYNGKVVGEFANTAEKTEILNSIMGITHP
ncbi:sugar ABC transporter ATP-binding protein [Synergistales bacterium]|nr:sugar ABC transporter ATP-binding protein [Synergistales bacterium]